MALSAANVIQAKTDFADATTTPTITLDAATSPGGTLTVEVFGPSTWADMPDGWVNDFAGGSSRGWVFRYPTGAGGETSFSGWVYIAAVDWLWRITEWDVGLDPVSALEGGAVGSSTSGVISTFSTGTTPAVVRDDVVALCAMYWSKAPGASAQSFDFGSWTNSFTERDDFRHSVAASTSEYDAGFAWKFESPAAGATYSTTATITTTPQNVNDTYRSTLVPYAASVPVVVAGPTVMAG